MANYKILFKSLKQIVLSTAQILQPNERLSVSQAAEKFRYVNQPGAYVGWWKNKTTPMMVEPMDTFTSRHYDGLIFVGPAQSGKTDSLIINVLAYTIKIRPMDTMLVCPTQTAARDFSIRRIDRLHAHSKEIGAMQLSGSDNDNKFDKHYINGMILSLSWPTPTELAGKPIGIILMTDYDRMPMDVGGDGSPYDLGSKRTTTFGSYAMTLAESSPSKEVTNLKWIPRTLHEAPPCEGILALYNRGDRRRWYWPCPKCGEYFEGKFTHLEYVKVEGQTNLEASESTRMKCPHCTYSIHPDKRESDMNPRGVWLKDGQAITKDGEILGGMPRTKIASFWMNGVAAVFTNWKKLVRIYLDAQDEYERTGTEDALRKFYNNDLGEPYIPKSSTDLRLPEVLKARALKLSEYQVRKVPPSVAFLIATIDVQNNQFVVQVFGIMPGRPFDMITIDRFDIRKSNRLDDDGERLWVKPGTYEEDWDLIEAEVMDKTYAMEADDRYRMQIKMTCCDSGGREGVTTAAYNFYRRLRQKNKHQRFVLVKGEGKPGNPRTRTTTPDSNRRDAKAVARGDVPVVIFNSNLLKDDLNNRLDCLEPGKGMYFAPDWVGDTFFAELCTEFRGPKGWENPAGHRNETWDLSYYCIGICVSEWIRVETLNWENPPGWANPDHEKNDLVIQVDGEVRFANTTKTAYDFAQFAKALA